jgi:hypothetical protein
MIFRAVATFLGQGRKLAPRRTLIAALGLVGLLAAFPVQAATLKRVDFGAPSTATFLLSGLLVGGELSKLQAEVGKLPPSQRIVVILDSPGGLLVEGLRLGKFFHDARIATLVAAGGIGCHSACSLAFLGGRDAVTGKRQRAMMSGAKLGFHQFSARFDPGRTYTQKDMSVAVEEAHRVMDAIIGYLRSIDEDLSFLTLMLKAPHESMTLLDEEGAIKRGIEVLGRSAPTAANMSGNSRVAVQ